MGPTASGKSALALEVAGRLGDAEIVSADALQVYRGMDIGTAKPTAPEREAVPHHLVDVAEPSEEYSLARYVEQAGAALADIAGRGRRAIVVGGTGLYVRGVVDGLEVPGQWPAIRAELEAEPDAVALHGRLAGLDPVAAGRMEPTNHRRVVRALEVCLGTGRPFSSFGPGLGAYPPVATVQVGIDLPTEVLDQRIEDRVGAMVVAGLVAEVAQLAATPGGLSRTARQALGYRQVLDHLEGRLSLDEAIAETVVGTRRLARRQRRWFRRDPRIQWLDEDALSEELVRAVDRINGE